MARPDVEGQWRLIGRAAIDLFDSTVLRRSMAESTGRSTIERIGFVRPDVALALWLLKAAPWTEPYQPHVKGTARDVRSSRARV